MSSRILDYIAYAFTGTAALALVAWVVYLVYEAMKSGLGRGILLLIAIVIFVAGTALSIIWLIIRQFT